MAETTVVIVKGFSEAPKVAELLEYFGKVGTVDQVSFVGSGDGTYITFTSKEDAQKALSRHGASYRGDTLSVELVKPVSKGLSDASALGGAKALSGASNAAGNAAGVDKIKYVRVDLPFLPNFSGDRKGDSYINYNLWKHELNTMINDPSLSVSVIWQAIHRSVKGVAAEVLMNMGHGPHVTFHTALDKFEVLFGNTQSLEQLLQSFYLSKQQPEEAITTWGCRLEDMMVCIQREGMFIDATAKEMLKGKFFSGLHSDHVKSCIRHRLDAGDQYEELLKKARAFEIEESNKTSKGSTTKVHQQQTSSVDKLDQILQQLRALDGRVQKIENQSKPTKNQNQKFSSFTSNSSGQASQAKQQTQKRGPIICHNCGELGHIRPRCPELQDKPKD